MVKKLGKKIIVQYQNKQRQKTYKNVKVVTGEKLDEMKDNEKQMIHKDQFNAMQDIIKQKQGKY